MNTQDENQNAVDNTAYNPFPEPQTIPAGWDLSEMFCSPETVSKERVEEPTERKSN